MFCPNCGKQNPDDAKFCESCGSTLSAAAAPKAEPVAPPPQPPIQPPLAQYSAPPPPPPAYQAPPRQQNYYQQPPPAYNAAGNTAPMSVGSYIGTMILFAIPLVGFILMLVWAFGSNVNQNKKNLSRAYLIMMLIGIVLAIVLSVLAGSALSSWIEAMYGYY